MTNHWKDGTHKATLSCPSCEGSGRVEDAKCLACNGVGTYEVGCGGRARVDEQFALAECLSCGMVHSSEVSVG